MKWFSDRNSRLKLFCKIGILENLQNSQENTCANVYFLKKRHWCRCFPVNFAKSLIRNTVFQRTPLVVVSIVSNIITTYIVSTRMTDINVFPTFNGRCLRQYANRQLVECNKNKNVIFVFLSWPVNKYYSKITSQRNSL